MSSPNQPALQVYPTTLLHNVEALREVYEDSVRFPMPDGPVRHEEVQEDLDLVRDSNAGLSSRRYLFAQDTSGLILGVMGLQIPEEAMLRFSLTDKPIELINAYALRNSRAKGVGSTLLAAIEVLAKESGHEEIILNSGPRYKETGWPFWRKKYGDPVGILEDRYGPGLDAMVWRKVLSGK